MTPEQQASWKLAAARAAVADVPDGAVLGLGSGSTAEIMLHVLAERVREGLRVTGVPTSERTHTIARSLGIEIKQLDDVPALDLSIDGADEVALPALDLVKGRGGALLREKLVASSSRHRIIVVDASKIVTTLGTHFAIPVEVEPFGWRHTAERLARLGGNPVLRPSTGPVASALPAEAPAAAAPYITDGGHYVLDCSFGPIPQPGALEAQIKGLRGVVDCGLFVGMTERVYVAGPQGTQRFDRP